MWRPLWGEPRVATVDPPPRHDGLPQEQPPGMGERTKPKRASWDARADGGWRLDAHEDTRTDTTEVAHRALAPHPRASPPPPAARLRVAIPSAPPLAGRPRRRAAAGGLRALAAAVARAPGGVRGAVARRGLRAAPAEGATREQRRSTARAADERPSAVRRRGPVAARRQPDHNPAPLPERSPDCGAATDLAPPKRRPKTPHPNLLSGSPNGTRTPQREHSESQHRLPIATVPASHHSRSRSGRKGGPPRQPRRPQQRRQCPSGHHFGIRRTRLPARPLSKPFIRPSACPAL